jgi:threonine dehydrogenase-like Zn-dependent dehydrogenase
MLRASGAAQVLVLEVSKPRRELALAMGADLALDPRDGLVREAVLDATEGLGADLQIEAAGAFAHTLPAMEQSVAIGGTILVIGRDAAHVSIYPEPLQVKRARLVLAKGNAGLGTYPHVLRLMASVRIDPRPMITGRYPFDQILTALETSRTRGHGKILVTIA